jgi:TetR/AcrR family transcriptional repressor of nem operon
MKKSGVKKKADKRSRLIQAAVKLAHKQGFRRTTLAEIAQEAQAPLGNVYYYFKTKDEIGEAIVERRISEIRARQREWDQLDSPQERLQSFVRMTLDNRNALARGGCPLGTLCAELRKEGGPLAKKATLIFAEPLAWIEAQFRALGKGDDSRGLATHLLSALQGVAVIASGFQDPDFVVMETDRLIEWIRAL